MRRHHDAVVPTARWGKRWRASHRIARQLDVTMQIPRFVLRGFWDDLARRGVAAKELEAASGLSCPREGDFASTMPGADVHRLFEAGVALTGDEQLGLSVGRAIGLASFHLLGHLALASPTLLQAIEYAARAEPQLAMCLPTLYDLGDGNMRYGVFYDTALTPGARVEADLSAVLLHDIALLFLDPRYGSPSLQFPFRAPEDASVYRRFFAGGLQFSCDGTFCVFPTAALLPRRSGSDLLLLEKLFDLAQEQYGARSIEEDWPARVRRALRVHPTPPLLDATALAAQLGVSRYALARRLARRGESLSRLFDEVLYERAKHLLKRPGITTSEVAETLGYAELSSFFRAFRRWSGGKRPGSARH